MERSTLSSIRRVRRQSTRHQGAHGLLPWLCALVIAAPASLAAKEPPSRDAEAPVLAVMERSTDERKPLMRLTATGAQPLDTHEARLDLRIAYTRSRIWNPATPGYDEVNLRSYHSPGTNPETPFVAPTIVTAPGETVRIRLENQLPQEPDCKPPNVNIPHCFNSTNLHSHGLWVSPTGNSDNVLLTLRPGVTFEYEYNLPADHPAGTYWYHPHLHGSTALQVSSGMAGALLIRGSRLPAPERNGDVDTLLRDLNGQPFHERVLLFQQVAYACRDANGAIKVKKNAAGDVIAWVCDPGEVGSIEGYDQFGFAPGASVDTWVQSGRHTSINGSVLPTFNDVVAGRIERWRMLHAGVRDTISLQLRELRTDHPSIEGLSGAELDSWVTQNCTGPVLTQFEVAADGLTHGQAIEKGQNVLQPGYRSDALVVFPKAGQYCVLDAAAPADGSITNAAEDRQLLGIATARSEGAPPVTDVRAFLTNNLVAASNMFMPTDTRAKVTADLRNGLRLDAFVPHKSIPKSEVTGTQDLVFNIDLDKTPFVYMVDGKPYDPNTARQLVLDDVDEWTLKSTRANHPFHIHVNPFQVVSILDPHGVDVSVTGEPNDPQYANLQGTWKDTLFVKQDYTVVVRTRYQRYIGEYVLHCHILEHEDQGMMQNVRVVLPDGMGGAVGEGHH
ncbi:multicopper oxidase family protein [Montanilutibacter psychrotolerans]|uniref:Multicopper oxidase family protein n=1 Tax=Montanilutibacter psychrotolerans TaxID=1327343 RepID=A0A3M8STT2_9GAMM|nr:multicopper oxidase domain-containing protein [Lysobacter psychrotolerans]RNF82270.1 multicopper oxidase family protein [Lysobacter psychrotolerans]